MSTKAKDFLEKQTGVLSLGKLLCSIRLADELTQEGFAQKLGISKSHLCDLEKGRKFASPERAELFAKKLKYPPQQFVRLALQDALQNCRQKYSVTLEAL